MSGREMTVGGKPLSSLRVVDLKAELDKVGLSKSGSKKELADRLKNHLVIEREREGAVASTGDEEELPNISMQDKLAEDNPFIREYFASQAELYHSQKVVKKLYQEEKIRESEGSGTSADEREKSPVKTPREPQPVPATPPSPLKKPIVPIAVEDSEVEVKNGDLVPATEIPPEEPPPSASKSPEQKIETETKESSKSPEQTIETETQEESEDSDSSEDEELPEPEPVITPPSPVKEVIKPVVKMKDLVVETPAAVLEPEEAIVVEQKKVVYETKQVLVEKEAVVDKKETVIEPPVETEEPVIETKDGENGVLVLATETSIEELAPPPPKKQAIAKPEIDKSEKENLVEEKKSRRIPITFDKEDTKVKKAPIRTISFTKDEGKVVVQPASKRVEILPPTDPVPPVAASSLAETKPKAGMIRSISRTSTASSSTETGVAVPDEDLDYGEEDGAEAEEEKAEEEEVSMDDYEPVVYEFTPRIMNIKPNVHSRRREEAWEKAVKEDPALTGWPLDSDEEEHFELTSDILLEWYPGTTLLTEEELNMEENPLTPPGSPLLEIDETFRITRTFSTIDTSPAEGREELDSPEEDLRHKMDSSTKRKVSMVSIGSEKGDEAAKEVTPPRSAPTQIIVVTNLVRPFTVPQLREILQRTGNVVDLWVDKIKSKCVAKYDTEDAALETRTALHGVRWPASNPKCLSVDFTTDKVFDDLRRKDSGDMRIKIDEKSDPSQRNAAVREWDMGKKRKSRSPVDRKRSTSRDRERKRTRRHSRSPQNEKDRKDQSGETKKRPEPSGKALDELFRKTVATPCIYWLPLNPQQIAEKEEMRRKRMEERERRIAELQKHRQR